MYNVIKLINSHYMPLNRHSYLARNKIKSIETALLRFLLRTGSWSWTDGSWRHAMGAANSSKAALCGIVLTRHVQSTLAGRTAVVQCLFDPCKFSAAAPQRSTTQCNATQRRQHLRTEQRNKRLRDSRQQQSSLWHSLEDIHVRRHRSDASQSTTSLDCLSRQLCCVRHIWSTRLGLKSRCCQTQWLHWPRRLHAPTHP